MRTILLAIILTMILSGCAPNSVSVGAMFIDLESRIGDIKGVAPIVMLNWNFDNK